VPPRMPSRFSFNIDLTSSVNAPQVAGYWSKYHPMWYPVILGEELDNWGVDSQYPHNTSPNSPTFVAMACVNLQQSHFQNHVTFRSSHKGLIYKWQGVINVLFASKILPPQNVKNKKILEKKMTWFGKENLIFFVTFVI